MPVMLSFWGKEESKNSVLEQMSRRGYKLNTEGGKLKGTPCTIAGLNLLKFNVCVCSWFFIYLHALDFRRQSAVV